MSKFSVLMATYAEDNPHYLKEALSSLLHQTVVPAEVVIVGDGPVPLENLNLIKKFSHCLSISFVAIEKNIGLGGALRVGLEQCKFSLVARFDTDDICENNRFERQLHVMNSHPNIDICGSFAAVINEKGIVKDELIRPSEDKSIKQLIWSCPMIHPSVMMRKSKILDIGSYKQLPCKRQEDLELWARAARYGLRFHNIPEKLIKYRRTATAVRKKNTCLVGLYRFRYGVLAWYTFDRRLKSLAALCYPALRPLLPAKLNNYLFKFDPRAK